LRFDRAGNSPAAKAAWQIEGTFVPEHVDQTTQYTILVSVRDERNEEIARHVVNVGSVQGAERRTFTLSIETSNSNDSK